MDRSRWRPEDLHDLPCPRCGASVEFMKDERSRRCPQCGTRFGDPAKDVGCAMWCRYADACLGSVDATAVISPEGEEDEKPPSGSASPAGKSTGRDLRPAADTG
jgi:hypothetical protein